MYYIHLIYQREILKELYFIQEIVENTEKLMKM